MINQFDRFSSVESNVIPPKQGMTFAWVIFDSCDRAVHRNTSLQAIAPQYLISCPFDY
ncbi:hypothetical protein [Nostoc sp.]|uniref:hypothetical protein n=1 Tax=Nostoc sp. TaxID=1180 RepID=UPI002FF5C63B